MEGNYCVTFLVGNGAPFGKLTRSLALDSEMFYSICEHQGAATKVACDKRNGYLPYFTYINAKTSNS